MKSLAIAIVTVSILYGHFLLTEAEFDLKACRSTMGAVTKTNMQLVPQCAKSMKFKNGKEKSKKQNCILRCALIKAGVADETGQVSSDQMNALLKKFDMPDEIAEKANKTFWPCFEMAMETPFKTLEEDPYCTTYDSFIKCFMSRLGNVCDN